MLSKHHNDATILKICVQSVYIGVTIDDKLSSDAQRRIEHERDNQQILREIVLNLLFMVKNLNRYLVCLRQLGYRIQKINCGLNKRAIQNLKEQAKEILL